MLRVLVAVLAEVPAPAVGAVVPLGAVVPPVAIPVAIPVVMLAVMLAVTPVVMLVGPALAAAACD